MLNRAARLARLGTRLVSALAGLLMLALLAFGGVSVLAQSRAAGCVVGPKAVLTKHNKTWPLARLIAAVNAEHAAMPS